jgi:hypothetical protein
MVSQLSGILVIQLTMAALSRCVTSIHIIFRRN